MTLCSLSIGLSAVVGASCCSEKNLAASSRLKPQCIGAASIADLLAMYLKLHCATVKEVTLYFDIANFLTLANVVNSDTKIILQQRVLIIDPNRVVLC